MAPAGAFINAVANAIGEAKPSGKVAVPLKVGSAINERALEIILVGEAPPPAPLIDVDTDPPEYAIYFSVI
jgi:hypothetical protein